MSAHTHTTDSTDPEPPTPEELADLLGTDTVLLRRFVDDHPNPTAPIVLGWATREGRLSRPPAELRELVASFLDARPARPTPDQRDITDVTDDGRIHRAFGVSSDE